MRRPAGQKRGKEGRREETNATRTLGWSTARTLLPRVSETAKKSSFSLSLRECVAF